jgi:outer membrane protein assembly factor BamB
MAALRETAKDLWNNYRLATIAAGASVIALLGGVVAAYLLLKRPSDVLDVDAPFVAEERRASSRSVDWPTYGYDNKRTRYLPSKGLKPPFRKLWGYDAKELLEYSPIIVGGVIYGLNKDADAFAVHGKTGQVLWERRIGRLNASSFTYGHGRLYNVNLQPQQALAVDPATGKTIWKRELPGRLESSPVIYRNRVILGCECGTLYALDGATGKTIWQTDLAGEVKAAPSLKGGIVYVGDYGSEMWAIRARDGGVEWRASGQSQGFARSGRFYAAPAIAFGRVYAGNVDGRMYSFQADSGELAWSKSTGGLHLRGAGGRRHAGQPAHRLLRLLRRDLLRAGRSHRRGALDDRSRRDHLGRGQRDRGDRLRLQPRRHRDGGLQSRERPEGVRDRQRRLQSDDLRRAPALPDRVHQPRRLRA